MKELHVYQPANCIQLDSPAVNPTVRMLLTVLYELQHWLKAAPIVSRDTESGSTICLLFRDCACTGEDLCQMFGSALADLSPRWKADLYGTEPCSQETVWYRFAREEAQCWIRESTLSGRQAETIQSLCLCLTCGSSHEAEAVQQLLRAMDWKRGLAAVEWKCGDSLGGESGRELPEPGLYCYESVFECPEAEACLAALSLEQKVRLWMAFLAEDRECVEFQWLYDAIARRILENRIEWELSLYEAMKRLGYSIQADQRRFMLCDGQGRRRYFGADSVRNSERALMKILFPLNLQEL